MDKIVRVLQVFTILDRGGSETMIMNYYRNIDRSKIQFDFLAHRPQRGAYEDEIEKMGGRIFRLPEINPLFPGAYYKELNKFFQEHKEYKIIHSHINTFSRFPLKIAAQSGIKCRIIHAHTTTNPINASMLFNNPKEVLKIVYKNIQRISVSKNATNKFSCGAYAGEWLYGENSKFEIINNAINSKLFVYNKDVSLNLKNKFGLENNKIFGHIGNFSYAKNYHLLLSIFKEIKKKSSDSKLVLIGNGGLRNEIELLAEDLDILNDILFLGIRSDIAELLQMMDVFIFPSLYEGLPVTLVEAQAAGLKVFASDTITHEVALTDDIEFLSIKESPEFWAEKILTSIPYERKNNYELIKAKGYDIEENARKLQDFYLEQIEKR